jgi:hypothetical protein
MAMVTHAAGETGPAVVGTHAVVLSVDSEENLQVLSQKLAIKGIEHHLVFEPDAPFNGALMAIGLPPGPKQKALGHVPLWFQSHPSLSREMSQR